MRGCWFSFDSRTISESASYARKKEITDEWRGKKEKDDQGCAGGLSATKGYEEESVIPNDQRAADSALMSSHNDKWYRGPRLSLTAFIHQSE